MKRICSLFLFVCLLLTVSSASAYVVSHRYLIPNTTYTVEIPWFLATMSKNSNKYEPFIYEFDFSLEQALNFVNKYNYSMLSMDINNDNLSLYVIVSDIDASMRTDFESISDSMFDVYASALAKEYYTNSDSKPYNINNEYTVAHFEHVRCVELQNKSSGKKVFQQFYFILNNDKIISLQFDYWNQDSLEESKQIAVDIMNSIQDGYMYYSN